MSNNFMEFNKFHARSVKFSNVPFLHDQPEVDENKDINFELEANCNINCSPKRNPTTWSHSDDRSTPQLSPISNVSTPFSSKSADSRIRFEYFLTPVVFPTHSSNWIQSNNDHNAEMGRSTPQASTVTRLNLSQSKCSSQMDEEPDSGYTTGLQSSSVDVLLSPTSNRMECSSAMDQWLASRLALAGNQLIGRHTGQRKLDIIAALSFWDSDGLLLWNFFKRANFSARDLRCLSAVSSLWRNLVRRWVVSHPSVSNKTSLSSSSIVRHVSRLPENYDLRCTRNRDKMRSPATGFSVERIPLTPLLSNSPIVVSSTLSTNNAQLANTFEEPKSCFGCAASTLLSGESLRRCARCCSSPAIVTSVIEGRAVCTGVDCGAQLCILCNYDWHGAAPCPRRISPTVHRSPSRSIVRGRRLTMRKMLRRL